MLKKGRRYTAFDSELLVYVNKVVYESEDYYKAKITIINKRNGIYYEGPKYYKLYKSKISHWRAHEPMF